MTASFEEKMRKEAEELGILLTEKQLLRLYRYYEMLTESNKVMNLTAITEEAEVVTKHFTDSMAVIKANVSRETSASEWFSGKTLIDVGTGAGFPGLVLKIVFPELSVTLSDSLKKRLGFLEGVILELGLRDIRTLHGRAEDLSREAALRERFDFAVSRAVANLSTLSEYDLPFVRLGGYFIAMKSGEIEEELRAAENAIRLLGGRLKEKLRYTLPGGEIERSLLLIQKERACPGRFPRKAGTPAREPLK